MCGQQCGVWHAKGDRWKPQKMWTTAQDISLPKCIPAASKIKKTRANPHHFPVTPAHLYPHSIRMARTPANSHAVHHRRHGLTRGQCRQRQVTAIVVVVMARPYDSSDSDVDDRNDDRNGDAWRQQ